MQERHLKGRGIPVHFFEEAVPQGGAVKGILVFNPAMGTKAKFYAPLAQAFAEQGYHVMVHELRGNGISPLRASRRCDFGYGDLLQDLHYLIRDVKSRFGDLPIILGGHSLGGQLSLLYTVQHPENIGQVLLVACGTPHWSGFRGGMRWLLKVVPHLFTSSAALVGYFPGDRWGFGGVQGKTLITEWGHLAKTNQFRVTGDDRQYETELAAIPIPIKAFCFTSDSFAPKQAVNKILEKLPQEKVKLHCLGNQEIGFKADHLNWVNHAEELMPNFLEALS